MALSNSGLYGIAPLGSMPQEPDMQTLGLASSILTASSLGANPPNTTECIAPMRAQASMATMVSGIMGI